VEAYAQRYLATLSGLLEQIETDVDGHSRSFAEGIAAMYATLKHVKSAGRKVMLIGNGASAAMASHQAADFLRAAGIRACAFNDAPLITCMGNDFGFDKSFAVPLAAMSDRGDVCIAISSSGRSANILAGVESAREAGCSIVTLSGFTEDNPLRTRGDVNFYVPCSEYGKVEVVHLAILHCINDRCANR